MKWYADIPDLDPEGFKHVGDGKIKLYKGGGGGTSTVSQVTIPKELVPYVVDAIKVGQKAAAQPYTGYSGQRIAGFTPEQRGVRQEVLGLETPGQFNRAMAGAQGTGALAYGAAQRGLNKALGFDGGTFGAAQAQQYMSPFQQSVTDAALREAQRAAGLERARINLASGRSAAAGTGTGSALERAELNRNLMTSLGDIQAKGSQSAFENAQAQFERDRASRLAGAQLAGQVGGGALGTSLGSALGLGELAGSMQRADLARLDAQSRAAAAVQEQNQKILSQRYQDFLAQRGYPMEMAAFYNDIVRGTGPLFGTVRTDTQPAPNSISQIGGLLTGLFGASRGFGFAEGGEVENNVDSGLGRLALYNLTNE